jgi:hypothetical protein
MPASTTRDPTPMKTIEEVIKVYPEKTQNVRKFLPKMNAPRDILSALNIRYSTTLADISTTTGSPVEIAVSYAEDSVDVVDLSAKTPSMLERYYTSEVVKQQTELVLRQFLYNENKIVTDTLATAPVETITVDTSADTQEPDVYEVTDAIDVALDNISIYTPADSLMIIGTDVKKMLFKKTPEAKRPPFETLKENNVQIVQTNLITNTAYMIPIDETVSKLLQVDPLEVRYEKELYDLASIFGREAVAYLIQQPEVIQKLDFTTQ